MTLFEKLKFLYRAYKYRYKNDKEELSYIATQLKKGMIALDIGSHKGGYLYWMSKGVGKSGQVIAFEPQPKLYDYLNIVIGNYPLKNVELHHAGLSSKEGEFELYVPKEEGKTSPGATFEQRTDGKGHSVKVKALVLDELLADRTKSIDLIKLDVEGHELEVFKGAHELLKTDQPKLIFECEKRHLNDKSVKDVFDYLHSMGYNGKFFWQGQLVDIKNFDEDIHQRITESGEIVDKSSYANNFVFESQ